MHSALHHPSSHQTTHPSQDRSRCAHYQPTTKTYSIKTFRTFLAFHTPHAWSSFIYKHDCIPHTDCPPPYDISPAWTTNKIKIKNQDYDYVEFESIKLHDWQQPLSTRKSKMYKRIHSQLMSTITIISRLLTASQSYYTSNMVENYDNINHRVKYTS